MYQNPALQGHIENMGSTQMQILHLANRAKSGMGPWPTCNNEKNDTIPGYANDMGNMDREKRQNIWNYPHKHSWQKLRVRLLDGSEGEPIPGATFFARIIM